MADSIVRLWNGKTIRHRQDGYMSLTDMAQSNGRLIGDWIRLKSAKQYLQQLAKSMECPVSQLIQINESFGSNDERGTWGHPEVAKEVWRWCLREPNSSLESTIKNNLAITMDGSTEVLCRFGAIDVLTKDQIIEVKSIDLWKHAIGQILVYGSEYPNLQKRIHLFGIASNQLKQDIVEVCLALGVLASFENAN